MASQAILKVILRCQNEQLLSNIADRFELDKDELMSKYLRPSFYLPVPNDTGVSVCCEDLKATRKKVGKKDAPRSGILAPFAKDP